MTKRKTPARVLGAALVAAWIVAGCVPIESTGGGGEGGGAATTTIEGSDSQVCGAACQTLIGCGASLELAACKADCNEPANANLVACFRSVPATCDGLSACVWSAVCSGVSPGGSSTCDAGQQCAVSCAGNPDSFCLCSCVGPLGANASGDFYALVTCLTSLCSAECGLGGDAVSCDSCLAGECATADAQCN